MEMKTRILIADDHKLFRDGLKLLLAQQLKFIVIGEAVDGLDALEKASRQKPDVILMDISMPELNGIEATRKIHTDLPNTRIIMLTMHESRRFIAESLKAGALGYLVKDCSIAELTEAVSWALEDRVYLSRRISDLVMKDYIKLAKGKESSIFILLSPREREVLQLIAEGKATKEIAAKLNVSVKTIETHRKQIMTKLNINSIAGLTKYAINEGLTQL